MKCPNCSGKMKQRGFVCSGHIIYACDQCGKKWEIKESEEE
jgi:transposase-like protein